MQKLISVDKQRVFQTVLMKLVIQRVSSASVRVVDTNEISGSIKNGLLILWGISREDTWSDAEYCIRKALNIKLWNDVENDSQTWCRSVIDNNYELLIVSQFTLFGSVKKGNKPDFHEAMASDQSKDLYNKILLELKKKYHEDKIQIGSFGNRMEVSLVNDGPVTIVVDSSKVQLNKKPSFPNVTK